MHHRATHRPIFLFFYFFYQASASPPARARETALDSARPYPSRFSGVPFSCASRLRWWTRRDWQKSVRMLQKSPFVAFNYRFAWSISCVQHARNPHTPPHKPTEINDARLTRSRTNKHGKPLTKTWKCGKVWYN